MRKSKQARVDNLPLRMCFEAPAQRAYPSMRRRFEGHRHRARVVYRLPVLVPEYEPRLVELHFLRTTLEPVMTQAYADGPTDSPHRYRAHSKDPQARSSLCMWHPDDSPDQRWVPADGLLDLIDHARIHLFKEAYWRETGEWLGPEVVHTMTAGSKA